VKTLDWIPIALIGGVVAFVGAQVVSAPARPAAVTPPADSTPLPPLGHGGPPSTTPSPIGVTSTAARSGSGLTTKRDDRASAPAPKRDLADIARRIELGRTGTYIDAVLEQQNNTIYRWPERVLQPLRIWVAPSTTLPDWQPEYAQAARASFSEWSAVGIPVQFLFVRDSVDADVLVTWIDHFSEGKAIGRTERSADRYSWLYHAGIVIALHSVDGARLDSAVVRATARHEVGHLLGLPHSPSERDVMFPTVTVPDLSAADRATIRLIYTLPPGPAR
jgi:predicted Zn-dependent protease